MTRGKTWMGIALACLSACTNGGGGLGSSDRWSLVETGRIGTVDGEGADLFTVSAAVWLDSTLYVLETLTPRVARFSATGEWLGDFAPIGDGPGEVRRPLEIGTTDDGIWVGDPAGARLEVYSRQGDPVRSYRFDILPDSAGVFAFPLALLADGSVLAGHGRNFGIDPRLTRGQITHSNYYRANAEGGILQVLYESAFPKGDYWEARLSGGRGMVGRHPLPQEPLVTAFPDGSGVVVIERWVPESGEESSFLVRVFRADGAIETEAAVPFLPVPGGDWLERRLEYMRTRGGMDEEHVAAYREILDPRPYYPPVTDIRPGIDGSIWLRREETAADSVEWTILDRRARIVGSVLTSKDIVFITTSLEEVWSRETDELDVERLVRYRVVK